MNNEFGVDRMSDAGQMFNFACTQIIFKDCLENNNMKVCELQVIVNDLYDSFVNDVTTKKSRNKKSSAKSSSRKRTVNSTTSKQNITINTMNNTNNKLVSVEDNLINNSIIESDVGTETKNNISNRLVSCNDVGVDKDPKKNKTKAEK